MSTFDDFDDVIAAEIPDVLVDELIRGAFEPELPNDLLLVSRVLRAAHGPIPGEDRAREAEVVAAMLSAMRVTPLVSAPPAKRARRRVFVAMAAAASVLGAGGVAAAAGSLPAPIQSFVHDSLSRVGVSVPSTDDGPAPPAPESTDATNDDAPGRSGSAPGQTGDTPGQSGSAPGQTGNTPGQSGNTPGQSDAVPPGQSGTTPGQSGSAPGQSGNTPGQSGNTPGQSDAVPPGQSGDAQGRPAQVPGQPKKDSQP